MERAETLFRNSKRKEAPMGHADKPGNLWSIVLAGGDGVRTKKFIRHRTSMSQMINPCF